MEQHPSFGGDVGGAPSPAVLDAAQARLERMRAGLPRVGSGVHRAISLVDAYAELCAVSMARAAFLGELLDAQYAGAQAGEREANPWDTENEGHGDADGAAGGATGLGGPDDAAGLIGYTYTAAVTMDGREANHLERVATGEEIRALVALEAAERDRAARLIKDAMKIGVDLQRVEVMRGYAATTAAAMRTLCTELGLTMDDALVLRAAKRAGLAARRAVGSDDGDPDVLVGPALSTDERRQVLRRALAG